MPGAENRRRIEDLESNVANIERMAKKAKVRADELFQPCTYVVEGCERLDAAFKRLVSEAEVSDWRALKQAAPAALLEDLAVHLGVGWPLAEAAPNAPANATATALKMLAATLIPDIVVNIFIQEKKRDDGSRERIVGTFRLVLRFGIRALQVHQLVTEQLEGALRNASGLPVRGQAPPPLAEGQPAPKKVLLYLDRTEAQRERAKGKAKGGKGEGGGAAKGAAKGGAKGGGKAGGRGKGKGKAKN